MVNEGRRKFLKFVAVAGLGLATYGLLRDKVNLPDDSAIENYLTSKEDFSNYKPFLGMYDNEIDKSDGHIDTDTIVNNLVKGNMNFYNYLIHTNENSWYDLPDFLDAAKDKGITVIVDIDPPSEPPAPQPYGADFNKWGKELANLSLNHSNLLGFSIDDFFSWNFKGNCDANGVCSPNKEISDMMNTVKSINKNLLFLPTIYGVELTQFSKIYGSLVDGILLYPEFHQNANVPVNKAYWATSIFFAKQNFKNVIVGVFADEHDNATAPIVSDKTKTAYQSQPTGIMMYKLSWSGPIWNEVAGLYSKWKNINSIQVKNRSQ